MSHASKLLLHAISLRLHSAPFGGLEDLSRELRVSRTAIFASHPAQPIKELSFDLGYNSPRSFARAVKRACGSSPQELRSRVIHDLLASHNA